MAGFTYATLTTAIQDYTEVDTSVFTATITNQFIESAENRINRDVATDAMRKYQTATLIVGQATYNSPGTEEFVRAIKLTDSNGSMWYLQKVDQTFLDEYIQDSTVPGTPSDPPRSKPLYYAMFQSGQGASNDTNYFKIGPAPDVAYTMEVEYSQMPDYFKFRQYCDFLKSEVSYRAFICVSGRGLWIFKRSNGDVDIL